MRELGPGAFTEDLDTAVAHGEAQPQGQHQDRCTSPSPNLQCSKDGKGNQRLLLITFGARNVIKTLRSLSSKQYYHTGSSIAGCAHLCTWDPPGSSLCWVLRASIDLGAAGEVRAAVHSLKDAPPVPPPGLVLAGCLPREDPRDVLLLGPRLAGMMAAGELKV
jgi:hypothetical protein